MLSEETKKGLQEEGIIGRNFISYQQRQDKDLILGVEHDLA